MSQNKVYEALKDIGGEGTTSEVRERLKEKYPDSKIPAYATNRMRQLEQKDIVHIDDSSTPFYVTVIDYNWQGIPESLSNRDFPKDSTNE
jgi:hypothetical protein